jgi:hypothetical protein
MLGRIWSRYSSILAKGDESRVNSPTKSTITPCWSLQSRFDFRNRLNVSLSGNSGELHKDFSFIAFRLAFTSFFTNVTGAGLAIGKLTIAFVLA